VPPVWDMIKVGMLSVAIEAGREEEPLVRALTALVGAAADGLLRDVVAAAIEPDPAIARIADAFGCALIAGRRAEAIAATRGPWVLVLPPGGVLEEAWWREAARFIERSERARLEHAVATFRVTVPEEGWAARWREWRLRRSPERGEGGLLGRRQALLGPLAGRPVRLRTQIERL
jgi:hypothetical protein